MTTKNNTKKSLHPLLISQYFLLKNMVQKSERDV